MYKTYHRTLKTIQISLKNQEDIQEDTRDTILVSVNVKSLYTNIPNHEGIEAVKEKTDKLL